MPERTVRDVYFIGEDGSMYYQGSKVDLSDDDAKRGDEAYAFEENDPKPRADADLHESAVIGTQDAQTHPGSTAYREDELRPGSGLGSVVTPEQPTYPNEGSEDADEDGIVDDDVGGSGLEEDDDKSKEKQKKTDKALQAERDKAGSDKPKPKTEAQR